MFETLECRQFMSATTYALGTEQTAEYSPSLQESRTQAILVTIVKETTKQPPISSDNLK